MKFDDIINLNSNQNITTILVCHDFAGNSATVQDNFEYLHGLEAGQLALDVFNDGGVLFVNNASPDRAGVTIAVMLTIDTEFCQTVRIQLGFHSPVSLPC